MAAISFSSSRTASARDSRSVIPASASIRHSAARKARLAFRACRDLSLGQVRGGTGQHAAALGFIGHFREGREDGLPEFLPRSVVETSLVSDQQQRFGAISRILLLLRDAERAPGCHLGHGGRLYGRQTQQRPCPRRRILQRVGDLGGPGQQGRRKGAGQRGQDPRLGMLIVDGGDLIEKLAVGGGRKISG